MCYSLVNYKCQKFWMFSFIMVSSLHILNIKEHIIPHIPCSKIKEDNYRNCDITLPNWKKVTLYSTLLINADCSTDSHSCRQCFSLAVSLALFQIIFVVIASNMLFFSTSQYDNIKSPQFLM